MTLQDPENKLMLILYLESYDRFSGLLLREMCENVCSLKIFFSPGEAIFEKKSIRFLYR